ncbi:MAG TPA: DUF1080 domain-containing protein [Bacteroidales bacterium]|nr:DUF1080 domain-containing protein [Bacteroidales bacterium]
MRKSLFVFLGAMAFLVSCFSKPPEQTTGEEQEWKSLFNGTNLEGWIPKISHHEPGINYGHTFRVTEGKIQVNYGDYDAFDEQFGHLFYHQPFSSYHLKLEYRFTDEWRDDAPGYAFRNSGVMFHAQNPRSMLKDQDWPIAIEYQMLAEQEKGVPRPTGNVCTPGTHISYQGEVYKDHCLNSSSDTYAPDRWVLAELIVHCDSLITHVINGDTVLHYTRPHVGGGVVTGYDPAVKKDGQPLTGGYIALQSEGHGVEFRNIRIKELD